MIQIKENFSLKEHNTLGIDVKARYFVGTHNLDELKYVLGNHKECFPFYIMGGGSNILFTKDFNGIIIQPAIKGINILENDNKTCLVEVGAGENWDDFVAWAVNNELGGIENLSLIPGSTGSSPIQNIGAYGVEVKDVIKKVNFLDLETLELSSLMNHECQFDYRNSIFKNHLKNRIIITSVLFRLHHTPVFNLSYGNLQEEITKFGKPTLKAVREAVISIRRSKLPDPKEIGNAGSFFKNPVLDITIVKNLKDQYSAMPVFPVTDEWAKIPAGWLIEQCGWKGKRVGNAGVHDKQALVLVNFGNATGEELKDLAQQISDSVFSKFNILLEPEVNIV
jgi:UDP-N-acetylmuramate dehydrogenase